MNNTEKWKVIRRLRQCDYEDKKLREACFQELNRLGLNDPLPKDPVLRHQWIYKIKRVLSRYGLRNGAIMSRPGI